MANINFIHIFILCTLFEFSLLKKHHHKKKFQPTTEPSLSPIEYKEPENECVNFFPPNATTCPEEIEVSHKVKLQPNLTCYFQCSYSTKVDYVKGLRLKVHELSSQVKSNIFVSVKQNHFLSAWTLPILFPEHGVNQRFTSVEEILCPPLKPQAETLYIRVETSSPTILNISLLKVPISLRSKELVTVISTPVSPWYKYYSWGDNEESVLVEANSVRGKDVCALLSLQNAKCPIGTSEESIVAGKGRYQSFLEKGGMVARKSHFPDGVFIVVLPLPSDWLCTQQHEAVSNKTSRSKTIDLQVLPHSTIQEKGGYFLGLLAVVGAFTVGSTLFILLQIKTNLDPKTLQSSEEEDEQGLLDSESHDNPRFSRREERGGIIIGGGGGGVEPSQQAEFRATSQSSAPASQAPGNVNPGIRDRLLALTDGDANGAETSQGDIVVRTDPSLGVAPLSDSPPVPQDLINDSGNSNPRFVYWWKIWTEYEHDAPTSNISEVGFQNNLIIVAVFMALPLSEVLKSYLNIFTYEGSEDQCFFNSRCITSWGIFSDFSRVFTNIGYFFCGFSFMVIVNKHRKLSWTITSGQTLGVSRHYGLFKSLGYGLVIQGFMSGLYHVCPNPVTLRFDMMFMYVDAVVLVIGVWGLRHGGVSHHVYSSVGMVGVSLLAVEGREWISRAGFWVVVAAIHLFLTMTITCMLSTVGTWSFSPVSMLSIWKDWRPVYEKLKSALAEENKSVIGPWTISKAISMGIIPNVLVVVVAASLDVEPYIYILIVCLVNMLLYVAHYVCAKKLRGEKGTIISTICFALSILFWIPAVTFFFLHHTDTQSTPSVSRALNSECILFVFDTHDLWHILSSFGLYFSFVGILTLDDDLVRRNPQRIPVF